MHWNRVISSSGGSTLANLFQALEDYLPVLLGLVKDGKSCVCSLVPQCLNHLHTMRTNHLC